MDKADKAKELVDKIQGSIGYKVQNELELLGINFYVFDTNYKHWKLFLSKFKDTKNLLELWDQKNRAGFIITLNEITRLLLNFLASATSLVSATRNSVPVWYKNTEFAQEYEQKKEFLANDNECKFVEDLRNYSQHYHLPLARGKMQINENNITGQFVLSRKMLANWRGWAKGKAFLKELNEDVDLEVLVSNYYKKILNFHGWIFNRIKDINRKEIQNTRALQKELEKLLNEIYEL